MKPHGHARAHLENCLRKAKVVSAALTPGLALWFWTAERAVCRVRPVWPHTREPSSTRGCSRGGPVLDLPLGQLQERAGPQARRVRPLGDWRPMRAAHSLVTFGFSPLECELRARSCFRDGPCPAGQPDCKEGNRGDLSDADKPPESTQSRGRE